MNSFKKILKSFKIGSRLIQYNIQKRRFPLMANLLLTNRCNLKCFYCYPQVFSRKCKEIETKEWLFIIDELHSLGTEVIVLLGGEPLLHEGLEEIIDRVKNHNMICELITNGYLVKKKTDVLKKVDSICISLDGDEKTNDQNRGIGSYKKAVEAIEFSKSLGMKTRIKAVITRNNIESLDYLCGFAKEQKVVLTITLPSIHTGSEDLTLEKEQIKHLLTSLKRYKRGGVPLGHTYTSIEYSMKWPHGYYEWIDSAAIKDSKKILPCIRNDLTCYIDADGMMYPCAILWSKFPGKNVLDVGVREAWNNLAKKPCYSCGYIGEIEINLLLSLSPRNILESVYYYFRQ